MHALTTKPLTNVNYYYDGVIIIKVICTQEKPPQLPITLSKYLLDTHVPVSCFKPWRTNKVPAVTELSRSQHSHSEKEKAPSYLLIQCGFGKRKIPAEHSAQQLVPGSTTRQGTQDMSPGNVTAFITIPNLELRKNMEVKWVQGLITGCQKNRKKEPSIIPMKQNPKLRT